MALCVQPRSSFYLTTPRRSGGKERGWWKCLDESLYSVSNGHTGRMCIFEFSWCMKNMNIYHTTPTKRHLNATKGAALNCRGRDLSIPEQLVEAHASLSIREPHQGGNWNLGGFACFLLRGLVSRSCYKFVMADDVNIVSPTSLLCALTDGVPCKIWNVM